MRLLASSIRVRLLACCLFLFGITLVVVIPGVESIVRESVETHEQCEIDVADATTRAFVETANDVLLEDRLRTIVDVQTTELGRLSGRVKAGGMSRGGAQRQALRMIAAQKVGKTGYLYVLDRKGNALFHPSPELMGQDLSEYDLVRKQLAMDAGFLEYQWRNPSDKQARPKALFTKAFPDWGWIVAATSYRQEMPGVFTQSAIRDALPARALETAPILPDLRRQLTRLFLVSLGLFLPAALLFCRSISKPIGDLTRLMERAAEGDYSLRSPAGGVAEVGRLSSCFNHFLAKLESARKTAETESAVRKSSEEAARILGKFADENPNPILRIDADGSLGYANPVAFTKLDQWEMEIGKKAPAIWQDLARDLVEDPQRYLEIETGPFYFAFMGTPVTNPEGIYLFGQELTNTKRYESLLMLSDTLFTHSIEGISVTNADGTILDVNPAFTEITGYSKEEVIGQNPRILRSDRQDPEFYAAMWDSLKHRGEWAGEIWNRRKNGQAFPEWLVITAIRDASGTPEKYVAVFHDISELKTSKEKLRFQTYHDVLTELPNRTLLVDRLEQALQFASRHERQVAVLFTGLDNFKHINDSMGHVTGDRILKEVADRLKTAVGSDDTLARFSGDMFVAILPGIEAGETALQTASRIQEALQPPFVDGDLELYLSSSIGIALHPEDGRTAEELIKNAETAMYRAKRNGRNTTMLFTPHMAEKASERMDLEARLRKAVQNGGFHLVYQPKIHLASGRVKGCEALIRWEEAPDRFIPVAEETGLILDIGRFVLETACRDAANWQQHGHPDVSVAVNLSAVQFASDTLFDDIAKILATTGLPGTALELEITESMVMQKPERAIATMNRFAKLGIRFSIDDFGTGYSSLAYLKRFPIRSLKIDRSFVVELPDNREDAAIVKAICDMARNLGLDVVAEGVETENQLSFLRMQHCDHIQGYLFARPLPLGEFCDFIQRPPTIREVTIL